MFNDGIDIAIDLSGHTDKNRLLTFAYKPAPIQVSWIGFPGTTGLKTMDYYLVDEYLCPFGMFHDHFVEKLVYLPSIATFSVPEINIPIADCPALKNDYVTFGSFNRTSKITDQSLDLWCKVLNEVPTSKMVLGNVSDEVLQHQLENEFSKRGVVIDRLTFYAKKSIPDYLALHSEVDFILDTFPYSGATTTSFSLWMGVPVLTYAFKSLAGRVSAGMLNRIGLKEKFVAESLEEFVDVAKFWTGHIDELQDLRYQLRERMKNSPKTKSENVAAGLEKALQMMWEKFCEGKAVGNFTV